MFGVPAALERADPTLITPLGALILAMATVAALDLAICVVMRLMGAVDRGQRWFFLHSLTNWLVVLTGIKDVIVTLDSPVNSMNPDQPWSQLPGGFVAAIHIYHLIAFKVNKDDIFHHLVFAGVGNTSNYIVAYGPIANLYFFFICGLPGAIDYFMLALVKCGSMDKLTEKKWNLFLNLWIRGPGLTLVYAFGLAAYRSGRHAVNVLVIVILFFISVGNGQYYLERVVAAWERARPKAPAGGKAGNDDEKAD